MKKYEFTGETITKYERTLHRIRRLSDNLVGDHIESEANLSHDGDCFVFGNAKVFGNAEATGLVQNITTFKNNITLTDTHIIIGCQSHTIEHWVENINKIGADNGYTPEQIKAVKKALNFLIYARKVF